MTRRGKIQRAVGIALVAMLLTPVVIMSIPQTHTIVVYHTTQHGFVTEVDPEFIEVAYVPLISTLLSLQFDPTGIAFIVGYAVLFGLAIWLIVHGSRHKPKEV